MTNRRRRGGEEDERRPSPGAARGSRVRRSALEQALAPGWVKDPAGGARAQLAFGRLQAWGAGGCGRRVAFAGDDSGRTRAAGARAGGATVGAAGLAVVACPGRTARLCSAGRGRLAAVAAGVGAGVVSAAGDDEGRWGRLEGGEGRQRQLAEHERQRAGQDTPRPRRGTAARAGRRGQRASDPCGHVVSLVALAQGRKRRIDRASRRPA